MLRATLVVGDAPEFRILAPPFVCPKDKDAIINKPDITVITLQTEAGLNVKFTWIVRWVSLVSPTQRFTLALWRSVRELEQKLNGPPLEPGVYIIKNAELLPGVNYIFNVTASSPDNEEESHQSFNIDNIKGDQKLLIDGRNDMFSIVLVGGQLAYADLQFVLEAQATMCYKSQDYYFLWSVQSSKDHEVNVSDIKGSRLEIPPHSLIAGFPYSVLCQVYKYSNGDFITQSSLPFLVLHRDLEVNFNVDVLVISVNTPFNLSTDIRKLDYFRDVLNITWECTFEGDPFDNFKIDANGTMSFPGGLPDGGEYLVSITVAVLGGGTAHTTTRIVTSSPRLPLLQVYPISRRTNINENSIVNLKADISNVMPGCSITWYFLSEQYLASTNDTNSTEYVHGEPVSETLSFYSLEENFLSELTDYTNETGWKTLTASVEAMEGRARIVAECGCTLIHNCTVNTAYADISLKINTKPDAGEVLVSPETGTALETVFRLSTLAIVNPNRPLRYTFYCEVGDNTLILGSYLEYLAVETILPYVEGGTKIRVEICDSFGSCTSGVPTIVNVTEGEARTAEALLEDVEAYIRRCELMNLQRVSISAIITYTNAHQTVALSTFATTLLASLRGIDKRCIEMKYDQYSQFLNWLSGAGVDINNLYL